MFERTKAYWQSVKEAWTNLYAWEHPKLDEEEEDVDYWGFEMHTGQWVDEDGKTVKPIHSIVVEPHNTTWMEVLDRILDEMEKHYGYNIKDQVYYSVTYPVNEFGFDNEPMPGYGRCLNDEVLQQLLLAFPEAYHWKANGDVFK